MYQLAKPAQIALDKDIELYYKTKDSTLRNFTVIHVYDDFYSITSLSCEADLSVGVNFNVLDLDDDLLEKYDLVPIEALEYDGFIEICKAHTRTMLVKSHRTPDCRPIKAGGRTFMMSNPFWRIQQSGVMA